jgi:hypothetical protein
MLGVGAMAQGAEEMEILGVIAAAVVLVLLATLALLILTIMVAQRRSRAIAPAATAGLASGVIGAYETLSLWLVMRRDDVAAEFAAADAAGPAGGLLRFGGRAVGTGLAVALALVLLYVLAQLAYWIATI